MIKATASMGDRTLMVIGLSFGNLDKFRREPGETFIRIDGKEMGLPIGPQTKIHVDPKLRS